MKLVPAPERVTQSIFHSRPVVPMPSTCKCFKTLSHRQPSACGPSGFWFPLVSIHTGDPLGGMGVTEIGFAAMARRLLGLAEKFADTRIAFLLEGGYDL